MRILLVYPSHPNTFWSFKHALPFISKKAAFPPLGLLTVAAMLPQEWEKKLIDMNTDTLTERDIEWADYVFISAMIIQRQSTREVIARCNRAGTPVVAGGPLFMAEDQTFMGADHVILNEAEVTLPLFLRDLDQGRAQHIYQSGEYPDITKTPAPAWELIDLSKYSSMCIQYSRGCPFDCEFCSIGVMNGHVPRTKGKDQLLVELDSLYARGWRSNVFIVDDNFIGNKKKLKQHVLPAMSRWLAERDYPFSFYTETSINLCDDDELIRLMVEANFTTVFVGIETPCIKSLVECGKTQNIGRDLAASVRKLHRNGLQVYGGFIVGFDNDDASIFDAMIKFIEETGIVTAMVGLLNAMPGTRLYSRLESEGRLLEKCSGDNTDWTINFVPRMERGELISGYQHILYTIYSRKEYYRRLHVFLDQYRPGRAVGFEIRPGERFEALLKSVWTLGLREKGRKYFWYLMARTAFKQPRLLPFSMVLAVFGYHFRKVLEEYGRIAAVR